MASNAINAQEASLFNDSSSESDFVKRVELKKKGEDRIPCSPPPLPRDFIIPRIEGFQWRDVQKSTIEEVWEALKDGYHRLYYKLTVSGGKTLVSMALADQFLRDGKKVLWIAHTKRLLTQAMSAAAKLGWVGLLEQAENEALAAFECQESGLVIASNATLWGDRLYEWDADAFDLIIWDECDTSLTPMNVSIIEHFCNARLIGMTGTDDRTDGRNLGSLYDIKIDSMNLQEATLRGYTVPIVVNRIKLTPPIDLRQLNVRGKDIDEQQLEQIILPQCELICSAIAKTRYDKNGIGNRSAMFFVPGIKSSDMIADNLNQFGITAISLHSKIPMKERERGERDFVAGKYQVLVNPVAYTVGTNFPFVSCLGMLRLTQSRRLLEQMIGRGVRLPDNNPLSFGKKDCLVMDFSWLVGTKHKLCSVVDLFDDGTLSEIGKSRMKTLVEEEGMSIEEAKEQAEAEEEVREERKRIISYRKRQVYVNTLSYDPLSVMELMGSKRETPGDARKMWTTPSPEVIRKLKKWGVPNPEKLNHGQSTRLHDQLERRRKKGLCTTKQCRFLVSLGVDGKVASQMSIKEASKVIDKLFKKSKVAETDKDFRYAAGVT